MGFPINAMSAFCTNRLKLLSLILPPEENSLKSDVTLLVQPSAPDVKLVAVSPHVEKALENRPEIKKAELGLQKTIWK